MCGITTGGKEDCFWNCEIGNNTFLGRLIQNPECLLKCFPEVKIKLELDLSPKMSKLSKKYFKLCE